MKGLLTYDGCWLFSQKQLLMILAGLMVLYAVIDLQNAGLFLSVIVLMILIRSIEWNFQNSTARWLFTLPFTRRQFVLEKYLFVTGTSLLFSVVSFLFYAALHLDAFTDLFSLWIGTLVYILVFSAILIPVTIRLKANRNLWILIFMFAMAGLLGAFVEQLQTGLVAAVVWIQGHLMLTVTIALLTTVILFGLSVMISLRLMEKEEL
ncbi:ABC-2 transporter permease [uncultured Faecalibaculum sp.]|uniref:ABC-2 transporter permease n=1 Tax=uncultured Faecalibaculum sp. TaxID=1729681 RepID=UPI002636D2D9|nr:ABC-2 transporter permease [uncultured Faecalibaculum sp.]